MSAFIKYMHMFEPSITYEIAVLGNGGGKSALGVYQRELPIDILISNKYNVGMAAGLHRVSFLVPVVALTFSTTPCNLILTLSTPPCNLPRPHGNHMATGYKCMEN